MKLSFLNGQQPIYKFKKIRSFTLIDLLKQSAQIVLTQSFIKDHRQQLRTIMYQYQVQNKHKKWKIIKRLEDFIDLRQNLNIRYKPYLIDIPIQNPKQDLHNQTLLFFQFFLNKLAESISIAQQKFFKIFVNNQVPHENKQIKIYYQGYLNKRNWGRHNESQFKKFFNFLASWQRRYFSITKQGVYFTQNEQSYQILDNLMFSTTFSFRCGEAAAGYPYGILINSSHRALQMDAQNIFSFSLFVYFLTKAIQSNKNISKNRYNSFARIRNNCNSQYFIDGQNYFSSLCDSLLSAKKQIFITGWMISPYFSLKRPDNKEQYRLDNILSKVAKAGIKINIIIYNGPKMALAIDSEFTQKYLTSLSSNIKVLMHPNYILIPFMWSHHEKMVVVDQQIAYLGGLDLGYGRFDSNKHLLTDIDGQFWPGVDYCNYRVTDIYKPKQYRTCSIDRKTTARMPWHDIAVKLIGASVQDLCRHFIQYWNHVNFQLSMNDRDLLTYAGLSTIQAQSTILEQQNIVQQKDIKLQKKKSFKKNRRAYKNQQLQEQQSPLQDIIQFLKCNQQSNQQSNSRSSKTQQINLAQSQSSLQSYSSSTYELDRSSLMHHQKQIQFYTQHLQDKNKFQQFISKINPKNIINHRYGSNFQNVILKQSINYSTNSNKKQKQMHQIIRSQSMWSIGLQQSQTQKSIYNAYTQLIKNAQQFIYIQNQFFISQQNQVIKTLYKKIKNAYRNKKKFRVIILLPALPAFEGHPADDNSAVFRVQVHLIQKNIRFMYKQLSEIPQIDQYLYFFSLRTHGKLNNKPLTEIIYIHSKMMIIDDKIVLIGSANINDRSLLGTRDTQLGVVIQDQQKQQIKINEQIRFVSKFAHSLRKQLYMEHFQLTEIESIDYFNDKIWQSMILTSQKNHNFYRQLFGCYPDNQMTKFYQIKQIQDQANSQKYDIVAPYIKGHAIPFQKNFLYEEDLSLSPNQKQYFIPSINFT